MKIGDAIRAAVRSGYPVLTPVIRDLYRIKGFAGYVFPPFLKAFSWYFTSREYTNFTYEISERCKKYLAGFLANAFGASHDEVMSYIRELDDDRELAEHFLAVVPRTADRYFADLPMKYSRRVGWYAILRLLKPGMVVESGIDRGVGTCVLAAAMLRNAADGQGGKIIGLDINTKSGSYLAGRYASVVEVIFGDSLEFLKNTDVAVDIFIHDSLHSVEHETREFELVWPKLSPNGVLMSDAAHVTDVLYEFARRNALAFHYWQEEVVNHVAKPAGIALALRRP